MAALLLGGVALIACLWLLRLFATARVETIRKALVWGGGAVAAVLALALLFSGRGLQVIWMLALFAPMLWRWWGGAPFANWFRSAGGGGSGPSRSGKES